MSPTRRQFLATGAVAGAGMLAGCDQIDQIPFIGGGGGIGQYTNWVPAVGTVDDEQKSLFFGATSPSQINNKRDNLHPSQYRNFQSTYNSTGIEWKSVDMDLGFSNGAVYTGSFDSETVVNELTDDSGNSTEYTQETSESGYDIYVQNSEVIAANTGLNEDNADAEFSPDAYAVSGSTIVRGQQVGFDRGGFNEDPSVRNSAIDVVTNIIDVGENGNNRAVDENSDIETVTNELNSGDRMFGRLREEEIDSDEADADSGQFEGLIASGSSLSINGNNSKRQVVAVFGSSGDANEGDINDWIEATDTHGGTWQHHRDISVNVNENVATVTGTIDTYDLGR